MITRNKKSTPDYTALAILCPAVIALAIIPTLMRVTSVTSDSALIHQLFHGTETAESGVYSYIDIFSQVKGLAVAIIAVIMLVMALVCCLRLFRDIEKRSLVYVGASVAYVIMTLFSALGSKYEDIALFGFYDRAEGFFTLACYFVMFLFTMYAFRRSQDFSYIVLALMICTAVNLVIGLFQYFGNDLLNYDWFRNLVIDGSIKDNISINDAILSEKRKMYGALYHYNYMGSFAGMIVPLFTVLALTSKKLVYRIVTGLFALISVFMLLAGEARSGFVAVAAAAVVGIIVFARVLIRRWKITVSVVAAALVAVIGLNFVTDNAIFARLPSLLEDVVSLVVPAEQTDMFASLPVREITHNDDGSVSFTTQTDVLTMAFDGESKEYLLTDSKGEPLSLKAAEYGVVVDDDDFKGINFEFVATDDEQGYDDGIFMWFNDRDDTALLFRLFKNNQIHMIDLETGRRVEPVNAEAIGFEGKEKLGSSRGYIWSRTIPLLDECLVTGYGPDTFPLIFPQNDYLAKYYAYGEGFYITVDKPHNLYIQIFMSSGLIALVAFLAICVFYLVDCFRLYALKKTYRSEQCFGISVMLAIVGYLAAGMFNDSAVSVAPVFWILLGTGAALNTINRRMDKQEREKEAAKAAEKAEPKEKAPPASRLVSIGGGTAVTAPPAAPKAAAPQTQAPPKNRKPTEAEFLAAMQVLIKNAKESPNSGGPSEAELLAMLEKGMKKHQQEQMPQNSDDTQNKE